MLGKAIPYPQTASLVLCRGSRRTEPGMEPAGLQDGAALAVAVFRVYAPPPRLPLFAFSGATCAVLALVAYANGCRAGQLQG